MPIKNIIPFLFWFLSFCSLGKPSEQKEAFQGQPKNFQISFAKKLGLLKQDFEYYTKPVDSYLKLVLSEEFLDFSGSMAYDSLRTNKELSSLFKKEPFFRTNTIFFQSSLLQVSNAYASIYPFHILQINSSGPELMDLWSFFSWTRDTLIHEMTHLYQLSQNREWDRRLWPFFSVLNYRNASLPTWILEGDAVLKESIYGSGGRLWSGFARAFVFSQIQDISLNYLLKAYNDNFSGWAKYLHGAYFFSFLLDVYGEEKIKEFFYDSGKKIPVDYFGLSLSTKKVFGKDLKSLFKDYKAYYKDQAKNQKFSSKPALFKSKAYVPINSDKDHVYFLISDLKSPSKLVIFHKKSKTYTQTKSFLPVGKVFKKKGKYVSATNLRTSTTSIEYTLVEPGFKPLPQYNSQYVMDFYKNQAISLSAKQNHQGFALLKAGLFYDWVHSSVLADSKGNLYYFKQDKEDRILYKNKKELIRFKAYFSFPVEVEKGKVYFIGPTKYGSSLFVYEKNQGLFRLSDSDRIVSARKISDHEFLVSEIAPRHFEYKLISSKQSLAQPVLYSYAFKKKDIFSAQSFFAKDKKDLSSKSLLNPSTSHPHHLYQPFFNLFFKSLSLYLSLDGLRGSISFSDPLEFNSLGFSGFFGKELQDIKASYFYKKYRLNFGTGFFYSQTQLDVEKDEDTIKTFEKIGFLEEEDKYYLEYLEPEEVFVDGRQVQGLVFKQKKKKYIPYKDRSLFFALDYPLFQSSERILEISSSLSVGQKKLSQKPWLGYLENGGSLNYQFQRKYSYAYSYYRKINWDLLYSFLATENKDTFFSWGVYASWIEGFHKEFFLDLTARFLRGIWDQGPNKLQVVPAYSIDSADLAFSTFKRSFQSLFQFDAQISKVFNHSYYFVKSPFSLTRWRPLFGMSFLSLQGHKNKDYKFYVVPFVGAEAEFSLFHEKNLLRAGGALELVSEAFKSPYRPIGQSSLWLKAVF